MIIYTTWDFRVYVTHLPKIKRDLRRFLEELPLDFYSVKISDVAGPDINEEKAPMDVLLTKGGTLLLCPVKGYMLTRIHVRDPDQILEGSGILRGDKIKRMSRVSMEVGNLDISGKPGSIEFIILKHNYTSKYLQS